MILITLITFITMYLVMNVANQLLYNLEVFKFFKRYARNLVVLPNPNIFSGHLFQTIWDSYNYRSFQRLHSKHGDTFGMYVSEQPWVATKDIDLIKMIFEKSNHRGRFLLPYPELRDSIFQVHGDKWKRVRRSVGPTMTNYKVRSDAITRDIENVVQQLKSWMDRMSENSVESDASFATDLMHFSKRFALAAVILVTYKRDNMVNFDSPRDPWTEELDEANMQARNPLCLVTVMFPFLMPVAEVAIKFTKFGRYLNQVVNFTEKSSDMHAAAEKRKHAEKTNKEIDLQKARELRQRLSDEIVETYLAGKMSYEELRGTMLLFIIAGFETVAANMSNLLWQLAMDPERQEKCREAIAREGFDAEYLFWCIMESLRIFPPVPLGIGRKIEFDAEYKGTLIPEGTFVMPSIYCIHHDPEIWPEPEKFLPERWAKSAEFHSAQFLAFGLGPRNCVGYKLALHEMKLVMQMILTHFRIEKCEETPNEYRFTSKPMLLTELEEEYRLRFVPITQSS